MLALRLSSLINSHPTINRDGNLFTGWFLQANYYLNNTKLVNGLYPMVKFMYYYSAAKYFAIRNQSSDKVLDVAGGNTKPGASIIMYKSKENRCNNQLWYEDQQGFIRSKLNDYLLTKESGTGMIKNYQQPTCYLKATLNFY